MRPSKGGFTLVEMLVVIAIILILASLLVVLISNVIHGARYTRTQGLVKGLSTACEAYRDEFKEFPPVTPYAGSQNLHHCLGRIWTLATQIDNAGNPVATEERKPFFDFRRSMLLNPGDTPYPTPPKYVADAWGGIIQYKNPGVAGRSGPDFVDIWSRGQDSVEDTQDDITNWKVGP